MAAASGAPPRMPGRGETSCGDWVAVYIQSTVRCGGAAQRCLPRERCCSAAEMSRRRRDGASRAQITGGRRSPACRTDPGARTPTESHRRWGRIVAELRAVQTLGYRHLRLTRKSMVGCLLETCRKEKFSLCKRDMCPKRPRPRGYNFTIKLG